MANQSIEELKGIISKKKGVARPNLYRVIFPSINTVSPNELNLLCSAVNLPGRQIMTQEKRIGVVTQKIAYDQAYDDVSLSFKLMNDYGVRKYFDAWQNLAIDQDTLEIGYASDYVRTVKIQQLKKGLLFLHHSAQ